MRIPDKLMAPTLLLTAGSLHAEEVDLPFPFLEWSVYILLLFGLVVAIGIFIRRARGTSSEPLGGLLRDTERKVHSVDPETTVTECVRRMNEARIGAMLIMQDERLLGIFTERDAITRVLGGGLDPTHTKVAQVMTPDPVTVTPSTSLDEARLLVTNRRMRHLPVVDDGKVVGMVSSGDLTHRLVRHQSPKSGEA